MALNLTPPDISELKPRITVFGVGGAGGNAVNNMITAGLQGVDFVVANTDAQALTMSKAQRIIQMGTQVTQGLGAGSQPDVGAAATIDARHLKCADDGRTVGKSAGFYLGIVLAGIISKSVGAELGQANLGLGR